MLLVPLFFVLIAVDPPTMLLSMFGTYALSAPVLWVGRRLRRLWRGAARRGPGAERMRIAARAQQYLEAIGIDLWVPRAGARRLARPRWRRRSRSLAPRRGRQPAPAARRAGDRSPAALGGAARRGRELHPLRRCTRRAPRACSASGSAARDWLVIGEAPGRRGGPPRRALRRPRRAAARCHAARHRARSREQRLHRQRAQEPAAGQPRPEARGGGGLPALPACGRSSCCSRELMLAVGRIAAQNLLATDTPLGRLRGKVHHFGELNTPLIVTYHPAYLLRTPGRQAQGVGGPEVRPQRVPATHEAARLPMATAPELLDAAPDVLIRPMAEADVPRGRGASSARPTSFPGARASSATACASATSAAS